MRDTAAARPAATPGAARSRSTSRAARPARTAGTRPPRAARLRRTSSRRRRGRGCTSSAVAGADRRQRALVRPQHDRDWQILVGVAQARRHDDVAGPVGAWRGDDRGHGSAVASMASGADSWGRQVHGSHGESPVRSAQNRPEHVAVPRRRGNGTIGSSNSRIGVRLQAAAAADLVVSAQARLRTSSSSSARRLAWLRGEQSGNAIVTSSP